MSRKDYVKVAAVFNLGLREATTADRAIGLMIAANRMADLFAEDNARFDRERFMDACYRDTGWEGDL